MATNKDGEVFPEDVMIEILSWLPVKTLLQFKCVCKSWYEIIITRDFISKHLNNFYDHKSNKGRLLVNKACKYDKESKWCRLFNDETLRDLTHQTLELPIPSIIDGPCNGLYYVESVSVLGQCGLWNPATKEFKLLPSNLMNSILPPGANYGQVGVNCDVSGFGLDPVTNDYKVVVIHCLEDANFSPYQFPPQVLVYTLGSDSWRYWGDLPLRRYYANNNLCYMYLNGKYYWLDSCVAKSKKEEREILCFDMATEEFQDIPIPNEMEKELLEMKSLILYHDSVAILNFNYKEYSLDIWVIPDHGSSWEKKFSSLDFKGIFMMPYGYWNDKLFLYGADGLMLVDPSTGEMKIIFDVDESDGRLEVYSYKESLVSIMGKTKYI